MSINKPRKLLVLFTSVVFVCSFTQVILAGPPTRGKSQGLTGSAIPAPEIHGSMSNVRSGIQSANPSRIITSPNKAISKPTITNRPIIHRYDSISSRRTRGYAPRTSRIQDMFSGLSRNRVFTAARDFGRDMMSGVKNMIGAASTRINNFMGRFQAGPAGTTNKGLKSIDTSVDKSVFGNKKVDVFDTFRK